ncbi:velvet factor [Powellomyces hirtus]|nr:velvet factor [Powellomyces hirtus]
MSGFGNSDRRPVDPSPILQLITYGPRGPVQIGFVFYAPDPQFRRPDEAAKLVVHASLWSADGLEDRNVVVSPYYYVSRHDRSREDGHNSDEKDERDGDVDGGDEDGRAAGHVDGMEDGDGDVDGHGSPDDHQQHAHHDHHPHYHQHRHGGRPDAPLPPPAATTARSTLGSAGAAVNADDRNVTLQIHPPDSTGNLSTTTPSTTAPSSPSLSATTTTTTPSPTSSLDTDSDNSNESTADGKSSSCTRRRDMIQTLVGSVVSQCTPLKDLEGRMGLFAIFHDLSIRTPGQYRIRFSLLRLFPNIPSPTTTPIITSVLSDIVDVFQPKRFPGLLVTTRLSQHFANQGVPIHVRKSAPQNSRAKKELQE